MAAAASHTTDFTRAFLLGVALAVSVPASAQDGLFDCIIEARQMVEIRSPVEGLIAKILVERGDAVKRGQVVVTLESGPERAALAVARSRAEQLGAVKAAEAKLELARRKESRAEELSRQNFISPNALEEARTERMLAESELKVAREAQQLSELEVHRANEALGLRTLRSPIGGVVVERLMKPGELATTNVKEPIMRLAEIDPLNVEVILPAALYGAVRSGDVAEVSPETPRGTYIARVVVVDKVINAASGTFGVRLELPNRNYVVPAGARCKVRFARAAGGGRPNQ
ncbi:MAG: efflux RND transporter periplasmic adaptor subunit [Burkholderiales bacterium]|nr:efflux RND transporter periplasmic adaptor subunit [Burkholderiales bacterium]